MHAGKYIGAWRPSIAQRAVLRGAAEAFGLTLEELLSPKRAAREVRARQAATWSLNARWPNLTYSQLAMLTARRDHSTALHALAQAKVWRRRDAAFAALTEALAAGATLPPRAVPSVLIAGIPDRVEEPAPRLLRPRNDFSGAAEVKEAERRIAQASSRLLRAIRREYPERFAA